MSLKLLCLLVPLALVATACGEDVEDIADEVSESVGDDTEDLDDAQGTEDDGDPSDGGDEGETDDDGDPDDDDLPSGEDETVAGAASEVFAEFGPHSPGCAYGIRSPDGVLTSARGQADLDADLPIMTRTIFDIGSVSKQVTAGAIALLVVDGDLGADDDITEWLDVGPYPDTITVADLVHHTSGLVDYIGLLDAEDDEVTTMADALEAIRSPEGAEPQFPPGTDFDYSNTNYVLLAELVQSVSGQTLVDFADERIFGPLGMQKSRFRDDQGTLDANQAIGYDGEPGSWEVVGSSWQQFGDGAVHSTVEDMLRWAELFVGDVDPVDGLGSEEWLEIMTTPGPVDAEGAGYAGGIEVVDDGEVLTHGGSWIGYNSMLTMLPQDGVAVMVSCNIDSVDAGVYAEQLIELVL